MWPPPGGVCIGVGRVAGHRGGSSWEIMMDAERDRVSGLGSSRTERLQHDPAWKDNLVFNEYFHGDNGAGILRRRAQS